MWVIYFPHIFLFDSTLDHNSALHAKISEKSLLIESRIEFPDPMLMTLDRGKIRRKIIFSPLWFLILKLDHNSGQASMVFRREKIGEKGRGKLYKEKGKCNIESRIEFTVPKLVSLETPHGPITKFLKNVRKRREK